MDWQQIHLQATRMLQTLCVALLRHRSAFLPDIAREVYSVQRHIAMHRGGGGGGGGQEQREEADLLTTKDGLYSLVAGKAHALLWQLLLVRALCKPLLLRLRQDARPRSRHSPLKILLAGDVLPCQGPPGMLLSSPHTAVLPLTAIFVACTNQHKLCGSSCCMLGDSVAKTLRHVRPCAHLQGVSTALQPTSGLQCS